MFRKEYFFNVIKIWFPFFEMPTSCTTKLKVSSIIFWYRISLIILSTSHTWSLRYQGYSRMRTTSQKLYVSRIINKSWRTIQTPDLPVTILVWEDCHILHIMHKGAIRKKKIVFISVLTRSFKLRQKTNLSCERLQKLYYTKTC